MTSCILVRVEDCGISGTTAHVLHQYGDISNERRSEGTQLLAANRSAELGATHAEETSARLHPLNRGLPAKVHLSGLKLH